MNITLKKILLLFLIIGSCLFACPVHSNAASDTRQFTKPGTRISAVTGGLFDQIVKKHFPDANIVYLNSLSDQVAALKAGRIDAVMTDQPSARYLEATDDSITFSPNVFSVENYAFALNKDNAVLCSRISTVIRGLRENGTLTRLEDKWFSGDSSKYKMEPVKLSGKKGTLTFATNSATTPFSMIQNGEIVGFDVDVISLVCEKLGYDLDVVDTEWGSLIPGVSSKKYDICGACITINDERKKSVLFTEPDYSGGQALMFCRTSNTQAVGFVQSIRNSFTNNFIREARYQLILNGLLNTFIITLLAGIFGTLLGLLLSFFRHFGPSIVKKIIGIYINIIQMIPALILLMILYYLVFTSPSISGIFVSVVGFSLNMSAYFAEMLRSGIDSLGKGQQEAALALGCRPGKAYRRVLLPQAIRAILPVYRGEFINMLKQTSIVGYISVQDLTKASDIIRSRTMDSFLPLITSAILYALFAFLVIRIVSYVNRRLQPQHRKRQIRGVKMI